jgi:hypothetical protein
MRIDRHPGGEVGNDGALEREQVKPGEQYPQADLKRPVAAENAAVDSNFFSQGKPFVIPDRPGTIPVIAFRQA